MTLTKEEIEIMPELISFAKEFALRGWVAGLSNGFNNGKFGHSMGEPSREKFLQNLKIDDAATKYLLQLKSERERAGKLINGLRIIAEESKDMTIVSYAKMLINQYKNNQ